MSTSQLSYLLFTYIAIGVCYFWYHAFIIANTAVGAEHRVRLFYRMLYNPFWRTLEQELLSSQSAEFIAYVSRTETGKYIFIAGAILLGLSLDAWEGTALHFDLIDGIMLYIGVGVVYFWYQAYKISKCSTAADIRLRLFLRMLLDPLWRIFERQALASESSDFKSYIFRLEVIRVLPFDRSCPFDNCRVALAVMRRRGQDPINRRQPHSAWMPAALMIAP